MILDSLSNLHYYLAVHPLFSVVSDFISSHDFAHLESGRLTLDRGVYANVDENATKDPWDAIIECHEKFIDIHIMLKGIERIGICDSSECTSIEAYSPEKDVEKLEGTLDFITLKQGSFAVFFPRDAHMPGLTADPANTSVKKIVFKIPWWVHARKS